MTIKNLVEAGFFEDDTRISVTTKLPSGLTVTQRGAWFNDQILEYLESAIERLSYDSVTKQVAVNVIYDNGEEVE